VVVPEADTALPRDDSGVKISDDGRVVVRFRSETMGAKLEPPEFAEFKEAEAKFSRSENMRLLYVAATRARDHLVLVGASERPVAGSWLRAIKDNADFERHIEILKPGLSVRKPKAAATAAHRPAQTPDPGVLDRFIPAMILPAPEPEFTQLTVSGYCRIHAAFKNGAASLEEASRAAWSVQAMDDSPLNFSVGPKDGPTSPAERGTLFHSVMENSGFDLDVAGYRALAAEKAKWMGLNPSDEEIEFLALKAHRFQTSEHGQELKRTMDEGRLYRREWPFWLRIEKDEHYSGTVQLSGVVDLFYINDKGQGRLIDFKLAKPGHSHAYEKQLEIYAMAIKKAGFTGELESFIWYSGA
jgi:ATP-dependent exoDNAse (exonuclease V) beta subunit